MNTIKVDSVEAQDISREFVRNEVYANVGALVEYILRKSYEDNDTPFSYEDIFLGVDPSNWTDIELKIYIEDELGKYWEDATGVEWQTETDTDREDDNEFTEMDLRNDIETQMDMAKDYIRDNASPIEVLEWWAVSDYLLFELESADEVVAHVGGNLNIWGRQCSGQAILLDEVIQKIALERYKKVNSS